MPDKRKRSKLTPEQVETLYLVGLLTMAEIAKRAGVTVPAVREILKRRGVEYRGGEVLRACAYCGGEFQAPRYRIKAGEANHCSPGCRAAAQNEDPDPLERLARGAMTLRGQEVGRGQAVGFIDGDRTNTEAGNLIVFEDRRALQRWRHDNRKK